MNNKKIYKSKIYYNKKGLAYFIFKNHRYYLQDLLYNRNENYIYIFFGNCIGFILYDIQFSNYYDEYITYKIKKNLI